MSLPSYVKDAASYAKHPLNTMSHKASPFLNDFIETVKNKDFFHKKIIDPNDPIYKQGLEYLEYQAKSFVPFSLRNVTDQSKGIEQFFGITPASKDFQKPTKPTTNK